MVWMSRRISSAVLVVCLTSTTPARADEATTAGVTAALGLTAASGKTTISPGGGVSEAALLSSETLARMGSLIATITRKAIATKEPNSVAVFVLAHDQAVDLASPRYLSDRITALQTRLDHDDCAHPGSNRLLDSAINATTPNSDGGGRAPAVPADAVAAIATDTTIASIPLTGNDGALITAIAMSASHDQPGYVVGWQSDGYGEDTGKNPTVTVNAFKAQPTNPQFLLPSELLVVPHNAPLLAQLIKLQGAADDQRECPDAKIKGVVADVDAFAKTVTTPSDKGAPPIGVAAALAEAASEQADILRVALEQTGGTAVTRSNIWYTLGVPGAAVVSASVIASFRLTEGVTGHTLVAGFVRCSVAPVRATAVADAVAAGETPAPASSHRSRVRVRCAYLI